MNAGSRQNGRREDTPIEPVYKPAGRCAADLHVHVRRRGGLMAAKWGGR